MSGVDPRPQPSAEEALRLVELTETALTAQSIEDFTTRVLPTVARITQSDSAVLYIADSRLPAPCFFAHGFEPDAASEIESQCAEHFGRLSSQAQLRSVSVAASPAWKTAGDLMLLYPLRTEGRCVGLAGLTAREDTASPELPQGLLALLANAISATADRLRAQRQLAHLNTYLTVSSMLAQVLDLHELLEAALYCSMEAVSAEAASVLLLGDDKNSFYFYHVEGPAKPVLKTATFPAGKGIAGYVLQTQQAEIINDVHNDPRFYEKIDSESGFQTRNMIAVPLVAGEERIGVLEVLNKAGQDRFTEEERLLLLSIAEEIAFAIRNANVFEYVVNSYCKQRQGQPSCKGCKRPLGSWTPCVKYREAAV